MIALAIISACSPKKQSTPFKNENSIPVEIQSLNKIGHTSRVEATGIMTTDDETYLSFKTGGIIERILVKEGDRVQAGQLLATLDLTEIRAMHAQAKIAFEKAKRDLTRAKNLYKDSVATLEQMQNSESLYEVSRQQLNAAEFNLTHSEIRALKSGIILKKLASEGQVTGPGSPVLLVNGASNHPWILRLAVSDQHWAMLKKGDQAEIDIQALNLQNIHATVSRKSEMADAYTGTFSIDLILDKQPQSIAAGMIAKARIQASKTSQVWQIPYEALLDANGNEAFVFVADENNTAKKVKIRFSQIHDNYILVESGLENFSKLIVKGSAYLKDGSKIKIKN